MAIVNGYTKEHMDLIKNGVIVDAEIVAGELIFTKFDGTTINAGSVTEALYSEYVPRQLTETDTIILLPEDDNSKRGIVIRDNPAMPRDVSTGYSLLGVHDYLNVPIFIVPPAGGPKVFGDHLGVWTGVFDRAIGLEPWGSLGVGQVQPKRIFFCTNAPLDDETVDQMERQISGGYIGGVYTIDARAKVGDVCFSMSDPRLFWRCDVAGTYAAPEGGWVPVTIGSTIKSIINAGTTRVIEDWEELVNAYNTITLTLPNPANLIHGRHITVKNLGTNNVTVVTHDGSTILDQGVASSVVLTPKQSMTFIAATAVWMLEGSVPATHTHDDRYFTETETTTLLSGKSDTSHTHDSRYYTESEVDTLLTNLLATAKLAAWPVGSIYMSASSTSPATLLGGGTWVRWGEGRVPVSQDSGQTEFDTAEETGGAKTHTLTTAEIPAHTHTIYGTVQAADGAARRQLTDVANGNNNVASGTTGGGGAHNNLQPYIVCYMWKRTA